LRKSGTAQPKPRRCEALEPAHPNIAQASSPLVKPGAVVTLEQGAAGHVIGDASRAPSLRPLALRDVGLGAVQASERGLNVDESVGRKHELDLRSSREEVVADDAAQL